MTGRALYQGKALADQRPAPRVPLVLPLSRSATLAVLPEAVECPRCHRSIMFAVNRNGITLCVACDEKAPK